MSAGEPSDSAKEVAFRGYVSAMAARGLRVAMLIAGPEEDRDLGEAYRQAHRLIELAELCPSNRSVVDIWKAMGGEGLLAENPEWGLGG